MELKNLTSFSEFIFEADIPEEFSNKTKFSESLVGRGIFSLLRYLKQGIDALRLEYLRQKLDNEYFAGVLRLCAVKQINITNGEMPKPEENAENENDGEEENGNEKDRCELVNTDFADTTNFLSELIKAIDDIITPPSGVTIEEIEDEDGTIAELIKDKECANKKIDINNNVFRVLNTNYAGTGVTFDETQKTTILSLLDKIKQFLEYSRDPSICPDYNLTENEKNVIKNLKTCQNDEIKQKCEEILPTEQETPNENAEEIPEETPTVENYEYIKEELSGKISSISIQQILGDALSTPENISKVNLKEYLEKQNIHKYEDIDWKALTNVWAKNGLKNEATKYVNIDAIKKIQYTASRFIFRIKKTPTYQGITPSSGGRTEWEEESSLRHVWEKKIENVKSNWQYFLDVENQLDPFQILNLQDSLRKRDASYNGYKQNVTALTGAVYNIGSWDKYGINITNRQDVVDDPRILLFAFNINNVEYNVVCQVCKKEGITAYKYIGNIDFAELNKNNISDPSKYRDYSYSILSTNHALSKFATNIGLDNNINQDGGFYLNGIYFFSEANHRFSIGEHLAANNVRIILEYNNKTRNVYSVRSGGDPTSTNDYKIRYIYRQNKYNAPLAGNRYDISNNTLSTKRYSINVVACGIFKPNAFDNFFPGFNQTKSSWIIDNTDKQFFKFV